MASAAAVGVDSVRSPLHNDDLDAPGVQSAIGSREDGIPESNELEEDLDEAIRGTTRRNRAADGATTGPDEDQEAGDVEDGDADLFGDEEEEEAVEKPE